MRRLYHMIAAALLLVWTASSTYAQHLHFDNFSTEKGLSNRMVLSVAQDDQGFIWIGTAEGLDRYDGNGFKVFSHIPGDESSLGSSWINTLLRRSDGVLLAGTESGLYEYDKMNEVFSPYMVDEEGSEKLRSMRIKCLYEDSANIWAGTSEGLVKIDKARRYMNFIKLSPSAVDNMANEVKSVVRDHRGNLWVGTFDGLYLFNSDDFSSKRFEVRDFRSYDQKNNYISSLLAPASHPDKLMVGTSNGLGIMDLNDYSVVFYRSEDSDLAHNDIKCLSEYDDSHLLVGTFDGLSVLDLETRVFTNYGSSLVDRTSLPHETVWCASEDRLGVVWLGTGNGIAKINKKRKSIDRFLLVKQDKDSIKDMMANDIAIVPWGDIWVGTNEGIKVYDQDMRHMRDYTIGNSGLPHNTIKRLIVDRRGIVWVGTNDGIAYFDDAYGKFRSVRPDKENILLKYVYDLKEDCDGDLVVNISSGVCIISPETTPGGRISGFSFSTAMVDSIVSSNNTDVTYMDTDMVGNIWFGTINDGLFGYNKRSGKIVQYRFEAGNTSSINSNRIYTIHVDMNGAVWIGTDMGLCRLDPASGKFRRFSEDMDLSSSIRTITNDRRNRIWLCTMNKIIMYDYEFNNKIICDVSQDLDCNEIEYNSCFNAGDRIYFGGYGGIMRIDPSEIEINMDKAPVLITDFSYQGRQIPETSVSLTDRIVLKHNQNSFDISFSLMNFASPKNNKYSYILHGYDKGWTDTGGERNSVSYTGVDPGTYTFEVKGSNADNIFSDESATITIRIMAPWWLRWWAFLIYALILGIIAAITYRITASRIRLTNELRLEKLERNKIESLNKIKMKFFTNISHEFKTPLSLILGPIDSLMESTKDEKQLSQMQMMKHNAERMLRLINEILDLRKIDNEKISLDLSSGEIVAFAKSVFDSFSDNASRREIAYDFMSESEISCPFDKDKLEKILYNLLSNAFKFTPDKGSIQLSVSRKNTPEGGVVEFRVSDSGQGMSHDELEKIFDRFFQGSARSYENISSTGIGLGLTKEFVELHGGQIRVESEEGKGSCFIFTIPCGMEVAGAGDDGELAEDKADRYRIVLIDDNPEMLTFIKMNLSDEYEIHTASNGQQGLEMVTSICPDVVISDVMMPDMDGFELCRKVKEDQLTSHIPVILLTAKGGEDDKAEGYRSGADGYISKPFTIKVLRARIESLISSREKLKDAFRSRIQLSPSEIQTSSEADKFVETLMKVIEDNIDNADFSVQDLCDQTSYSYVQVYRKVKAITGETINELIRDIRLKRAAQYLEQSDMRVSEIMYSVGFNSHSYFTKCFKDQYGVSPKEYAQAHRLGGGGGM